MGGAAAEEEQRAAEEKQDEELDDFGIPRGELGSRAGEDGCNLGHSMACMKRPVAAHLLLPRAALGVEAVPNTAAILPILGTCRLA